MKEIWKDIPGYEGRYQASNMGRIKSLDRYVKGICHFTGKEFERKVKGRILKPGAYCKTGHLSVVLGHGENGKPVHQLVMVTLRGQPPNGMEVLHIDGNPQNNCLDNLRYGTRTDNILDVYQQGGKWRKLSIEDVEQIRFGLCCGIKGVELARMYGVTPTVICNIKKRRIFSWLK